MASSGGVRRRRENPTSRPPPPSYSFLSSSHGDSRGGERLLADNHRRRRDDNSRRDGGDDGEMASASDVVVVRGRGDSNGHEYDEYAWFVIFLLASSYLAMTRSGSNAGDRGGVGGGGGRGLLSRLTVPYDVVASSVIAVGGEDCSSGNGSGSGSSSSILRSIFYVRDGPPSSSSSSSSTSSSLSSSFKLNLEPQRSLEVILSSSPDLIAFPHLDRHDVGVDDGPLDHRDRNDVATGTTSSTSPHPPPYFSSLSSTIWVHDIDLGRGYLLLSDVGRSGRVWRWEVGGGPITIGRSLHMENSGCRSGLWTHDDRCATDGTAVACPANLHSAKTTIPTTTATAFLSTRDGPSMSSTTPMMGSASLAIEPYRDADRASAGRNLIVAEWGERRIVRVEGDTGARTPLVTSVPRAELEHGRAIARGSVGSSGGGDGTVGGGRRRSGRRRRRVYRPNHLSYTPFGDLLFSDTFPVGDAAAGDDTTNSHSPSCNHNGASSSSSPPPDRSVGVIYRRKEAVHVSPISAERSREAHGWTSTSGVDDREEDEDDEDDMFDVLFQTEGTIEGMALGGTDFSSLYVLISTTSIGDDRSGDFRRALYLVGIGPNEEDGVDGGVMVDGIANRTDEGERGFALLYEMTSLDCVDDDGVVRNFESHPGSKVAVDKNGVLYILACPSSVTLLSPSGRLIGTLALDATTRIGRRNGHASELTSVGFGEDGYLYITSVNELMRVKSRVGGLSIPTNLIIPPP